MNRKAGLLSVLLYFALLPAVGAQYRAIDRHAAKAPAELATNLPRLTEYLTAPAATEAEKARSLYSWTIGHLHYDSEASMGDRRINRNLGDILRRQRGTCYDYAKLMEAMCRYAGLECQAISGYARTYLDGAVSLSAPNHAWLAVRIDGEWQLLDPTWADSQGKDAFSLLYHTDYFFTPPHLFVLNHLPARPMWQLLDCPVDTSWFKQTASQVKAGLDTSGNCLAYRDSIEAFLALPEAERRLQEAAATYRFHPSNDNRLQWAQALVDFAVYQAELAEPFQRSDSITAFLKHQSLAISYCEQAARLTPLLPWQQEFYAGLLINQAVALSQLSDQQSDKKAALQSLKTAQKNLEQAREILTGLPEDNYYRPYAEKQCVQFLEAIAHNIWLLE